MVRRTSTLAGCAIAAAALVVVPVGGSQGAAPRGITLATPGTSLPVTFDAVAGGAAFFTTPEQLATNDHAGTTDIYRSMGGTLTLMTLGAGGDMGFDGVARDGQTVFAHTAAFCDPGGPNPCLYRFTDQGGGPFNHTTGNYPVTFRAASADGNRVLFESPEDWGGEADGGKVDILLDEFINGAANNQIEQLLWSPNTMTHDVHFEGASLDTQEVVFSTDEAVGMTGDGNASADLYGYGGPWSNLSNLTLLSDGAGGPDTFEAIAFDGSAILYSTADNNAKPWNNDTDGQRDIYWSQGAGPGLVQLVSGGSTAPVTFEGASADLGVVLYSTTESLVPGDTDSASDVYARATDGAGADELVTPGTAELPASYDTLASDGSLVFDTEEGFPGDSDSARDLYRIGDSGSPVLLSGGGSGDATYAGSDTLANVYFTSPDRLTSADTDNSQDVYVNEGGTITLVSGGAADVPATFVGASVDGSGIAHAFFSTTEALTAGDTDAVADIYEFGPAVASPPPPPDTTPADTTPPTPHLAAKAQKNDGKLEVSVSCSEACTATPSGTLVVPVAHGKGTRKFVLSGSSVSIAAGGDATLGLKASKKAKKAAAAALKAGKKVKAKVTVTVRDAAGNESARTVTVKLKR
jgi:hypothetical protein